MKTLCSYLLLCFFLIFHSGCGKETDYIQETGVGGRLVSLNVITAVNTRALDTAYVSKSWEKKLNMATVYVFNPAGRNIYVRTLTTAELNAINNTGANVNFIVPGNLSACDLYLVANTTPSVAAGGMKTDFLNSVEQDIATYNGTYTAVTSGGLRGNGFVMTGNVNNLSLNATGTTSTTIVLRRIVAKVIVRISFNTLLNLGTVTMDSMKISQVAPYSNLFQKASANTGGTRLTIQQVPQQDGALLKVYNAMFYIYENDSRSSTPPAVTISLWGTNTPVLGSKLPFSFSIALTGDSGSGGKTTRNRRYFVDATINKLLNLLLLGPVTEPMVSVDQQVADDW